MTSITTIPTDGGQTLWQRRDETSLRRFLRTETGSAAVVGAAAVAALVWANVDARSYDRFWDATLSVQLAGTGPSHELRFWVNSGLMSLFFFVVGLEVRRELHVGELREHRRAVIPIASGLGGIVVPVGVFLAFNAGGAAAHGWGVAMPTDTAFALGVLALVAAGASDRLRIFMLTVSIADDVVALTVIAAVYSTHVSVGPLLTGVALFAVIALSTLVGAYRGLLYAVLGVAAWLALAESGVDPILIGTALGLLTPATPARRRELERASELFAHFREQPTPDLAHDARLGLEAAMSPNERLQRRWHPWTSYLVVPLFALANAGIVLNGSFLRHAITSPITLGILVAAVVGKPAGVMASAWAVSRASAGRLQPPVGWTALAGGGAVSGVGFTISLLIAGLAFTGVDLEDAKLGVLAAAVVSSALTWAIFRTTSRLSADRRARALLGSSAAIVDLVVPVDADRDHARGTERDGVTLVEYGDYQCAFCGHAEHLVRRLLGQHEDLRHVWRHLPLGDVHPQAQLAAEAAEAAANQGGFWSMHDRLLQHQGALGRSDLAEHARAIGLDVDRFLVDLSQHSGAGRIAEDVDSADRSGVVGTPTFFVDGRRLRGHFDADALTAMIETARLRRMATTSAAPDPDLTGAVPCGHAEAPEGPALAAVVVDPDVPADTGVPPSVHVVGELDCSSAAVVREQLLSALARGTGPFVVDLAALTFVDSSGLRALEEAATAARRRGRSFSVVGARPSARRLFALCGFPLHHHPEWSSPPREAAADPDRTGEGA